MITGINELKTLTKHKTHECKHEFDKRKHNLEPPTPSSSSFEKGGVQIFL